MRKSPITKTLVLGATELIINPTVERIAKMTFIVRSVKSLVRGWTKIPARKKKNVINAIFCRFWASGYKLEINIAKK